MLSRFYVIPLLAFVLSGIARGQNCTSIPISKSVIGKEFIVPDSCFRPRAYNSVIAWKNMLIMEIGKNIPFICSRKFIFRYRNPDQVNFVVDLPILSYSGDVDALNENYDQEFSKWCAENQFPLRNTSWAEWGTRPTFVNTVTYMIKEMENIRDYKCDIEEPLVESQQRSIKNSGIEAIISYLYGVAYKYGFCIV